MKTRTFIAIEASPEVRSNAIALTQLLATYGRDYRWAAEENLHFTLHFLGDITDQEIVDVCRMVQRTADESEPFELDVRGLNAFPSNDRPRTLWVGAGQGSDQLIDLHASLDDQLAQQGFRGENRKYVPHLTIGKLLQKSRPPEALASEIADLADYQAGRMPVDAITVYASELRPDGPQYHVLARTSL